MKQYIDKDAVVAEIEKRRDESWLGMYTKEKGIIFDITDDILSFLDTLEVKEIDLEKEIANWWNAHYSSKDYTFEGYTGHYLDNSTLIEITKYFFELGLKVRKGE